MERGFEETGNNNVAIAETAPKGQELRAIIDNYLSPEHASHPEHGCPLASLAGAFGRQPLEVRKRVNRSMLAYRERMLPYIPGDDLEEKRRRFFLVSGDGRHAGCRAGDCGPATPRPDAGRRALVLRGDVCREERAVRIFAPMDYEGNLKRRPEAPLAKTPHLSIRSRFAEIS